jgi:hypothetical protein
MVYEICRPARSKRLDMTIFMLAAKGQEDDIARSVDRCVTTLRDKIDQRLN